MEQKSEFGILQGKHIIYYRSGTMPYRIAIASTEYITHSVAKLVLDTKLPESCMLCSSGEDLLRIVSSLLENALKYEPEGGRVLLSLVREKKNAVLSVQNFGSSIAEQDLPHVFDRFYRSDKSRGAQQPSPAKNKKREAQQPSPAAALRVFL